MHYGITLGIPFCCKAINQNFDCGCDHCAILRLDSLVLLRRTKMKFEKFSAVECPYMGYHTTQYNAYHPDRTFYCQAAFYLIAEKFDAVRPISALLWRGLTLFGQCSAADYT